MGIESSAATAISLDGLPSSTLAAATSAVPLTVSEGKQSLNLLEHNTRMSIVAVALMTSLCGTRYQM